MGGHEQAAEVQLSFLGRHLLGRPQDPRRLTRQWESVDTRISQRSSLETARRNR